MRLVCVFAILAGLVPAAAWVRRSKPNVVECGVWAGDAELRRRQEMERVYSGDRAFQTAAVRGSRDDSRRKIAVWLAAGVLAALLTYCTHALL
ncbi:hypothetical protein M885DRAFT_567606 [Pelagophyceae sp. CCMP2097]|nr:hypothetical protein M885DRAFT_567606 [Pelagophyceae sp. CCMP2097]